MSVFNNPAFDEHESVHYFTDQTTGLRAIIAVHNTRLGPGLGGCRMYPYASSEDALTDVLRLAKGMTYKAAMANLPLGGGKAVIIGDPKIQKTDAMMRAMGQRVQLLGGEYITAEDSGMSVHDLNLMAEQCDYVGGHFARFNYLGEPADGNPAPATAYGVFVGLKEAVAYQLKKPLEQLHVAIQGMGHVGFRLAKLLSEAGARLTVTDIDTELSQRAAKAFNATVVEVDDIYDVKADVFAPCALGAIINDSTIERLQCKVIAGAANNQLEEERHGRILKQKGIAYAPDYILNAGGIIDIHHQRIESSPKQLKQHLESIGNTVVQVLQRADTNNLPTNLVANAMAEERFQQCGVSS